MDMIRQQLEFEAQRVRSVMEERFGTNDEMVQRTQVRLLTRRTLALLDTISFIAKGFSSVKD